MWNLLDLYIFKTRIIFQTDLRHTENDASRLVSYEEGASVARELGLPYVETSALKFRGLKNCFDKAVRIMSSMNRKVWLQCDLSDNNWNNLLSHNLLLCHLQSKSFYNKMFYLQLSLAAEYHAVSSPKKKKNVDSIIDRLKGKKNAIPNPPVMPLAGKLLTQKFILSLLVRGIFCSFHIPFNNLFGRL